MDGPMADKQAAVEKPAPMPLPVSSSVDGGKEDSAAALEREFAATTPTGNKVKKTSPLLLMKKQSNNRRSCLVARVHEKLRMLLMAIVLPPLMPVKKVCRWSLNDSFNMLCWCTINVIPTLERRLRRLAPPQAAEARVLPTAMLWFGAAGMAAAALALLLGRRRGRLALAYAALAAAAANHCLSARFVGLVLLAGTGVGPLMGLFLAASVVFFAARDLAGFRSLRKAAAEDDDAAQAQPKKEN